MTALKKNRFREWTWQNGTWILALLFALVNLWLTTKLAPLAEDIRVLQVKVIAVESNLTKTEAALIRIENKLDQLIMSGR
jgi:hypothetical protein